MSSFALLLMLTGVVPPDFAPGRAIPAIQVIDDSGRARSIEEWRGIPTILVPMYTRCPLACPLIAENLKRTALESNVPATSYRVVFFSFDPRDTPADLRKFRERHHIPLAWTIATASAADVRRLTDAIDFRVSETMSHPNVVAFLTPDLKTAKFLFGTNYDTKAIESSLDVARGGKDWLGRFGPYALAFLLAICTLSAIYLSSLLGR